MTAQFSGCRFVITDEYLAHTAHWVIPGTDPRSGGLRPTLWSKEVKVELIKN